eukprot:6793715-Pyramimonas_sp.AAC.1
MYWVEETHANPAIGALSGAPHGATKRIPRLGKSMRTPPLGLSVELPMGPRSAALGGRNAYEDRLWDIQ